jgi:hypothetical protein
VIVNGEQKSGGTYGLDYGAVLSYAAAIGAPVPLVGELLPEIEAIIIRSLRQDNDT